MAFIGPVIEKIAEKTVGFVPIIDYRTLGHINKIMRPTVQKQRSLNMKNP